jgi:hypothetical protein
MSTMAQSPRSIGQVSVCWPVPDTEATQNRSALGAATLSDPKNRSVSTWYGHALTAVTRS